MTRRLGIVTLAAVLFVTLQSSTRAADDPGSSAPIAGEGAERLKAFLELLNSASSDDQKSDEFKQFAAENFAPGFLKLPMDRHLEFFHFTRDLTRGVELHSLQSEKPNEATALCKNKLTGRWVAFHARFEPQPPYRIAGLGTIRPTPPKDAQPAAKLSDEEIREKMQSLMTRLAEADVFSGTVLLARDGVPIFEGAYGTANKDFNVPNNLETKFNLGSMNKMFTAVAIAQLAERGKLSFDDPLSKFLPEFPDRESAEKIQIKHLLSHTAGLGPYFSRAWVESSRALYRNVDDQMKRAAADEKRLLSLPGRRHRYSNTGMLVAGKVIEVASGQDYYDYVRENIYKPAGMTNTDCYELDKVNPNLAVGYEKQYGDDGITFRNNLFEHVLRGGPQGGGYSTAGDLLKFERALRTGKLASHESVKLLLSAKRELNSPEYGYGFQIDEQAKIAGHGGGFLGISSNLDMFQGTGWTAIVMSNYGRGDMIPRQVMRELVAAQLQPDAT